MQMTVIPVQEMLDISPRISAVLDLQSSCINGTYEIRQYICKSSTYRVLSRGDHTDMTVIGSPNSCIGIANVSPHDIDVRYTWALGSINIILISTLVSYIVLLSIVGIATCCACSCGGRIIRRIYGRKVTMSIKGP